MEDTRLELALSITNGDRAKAGDLLNLIDYSMRKSSKFPDVKMVLPEEGEECFWYAKGECWVEVPDSVKPCKGKCSSFLNKNSKNT